VIECFNLIKGFSNQEVEEKEKEKEIINTLFSVVKKNVHLPVMKPFHWIIVNFHFLEDNRSGQQSSTLIPIRGRAIRFLGDNLRSTEECPSDGPISFGTLASDFPVDHIDHIGVSWVTGIIVVGGHGRSAE
jgi:hypothetical protein